ncbi:MAG: right-handed parallel beta-helix repeat-containing protein [Candidatus Hodarchaeales archaeon]|jgi:parallel beta-helix repeat protein
MNKKYLKILSILSILFLVVSFDSFHLIESETITSNNKVQNYTLASSITISGDTDFHNQADNNNWLGDGSKQSPYLIDGLNITRSNSTLINITDTTVYFSIQNNYFDGITGEEYGFYLNNVSHGMILNNTIKNAIYGIYLERSSQNTISLNKLSNNTYMGIRICFFSKENLLEHNIIDMSGNGASDFYNPGIEMYLEADYNYLFNNTIMYAKEQGIMMWFASNNYFWGNTIFNTTKQGIFLYDECHFNVFHNNTIANATDYGLAIFANDNNNTIVENNFYWNNIQGTSQTLDNDVNNEFNKNYWNTHTGSDDDGDGYIDQPYLIDGTGQNSDQNPKVTPNIPSSPQIPEFEKSSVLILVGMVLGLMIVYSVKRKPH